MERHTYHSLEGPVANNLELQGPGYGSLDFQGSSFVWEQAVRILRKNRRFGLALAGVSAALVAVAVMSMKDVYQPVARVEIAPPVSGLRTLHEVESSAEAENLDYLETQTQILQSDGLAVSVIRALQLDQRKDFGGGGPQSAAGTKVEAIAKASAPEKAYLTEQLELATLTPAEAEALEKFKKGLSVETVRNTRLVEVSFASHDPQLAQLVTNEVITKFIENGYRRRYTATMQASEWLSSQLNDLRRKVTESAQMVVDYQRKHGLVEVDDKDMPASQLMGEANHQLSDAQASRIENEAYLRMIETGQAGEVPTMRNDQVYQTLLLWQTNLRTQLAQARAVYGEANSNVRKLDDQLTEVGNEVNEQRKALTNRIRTAYAAAKERESLIRRDQEKLRAQMGNANSQLVNYRILKNEAQATSDLYNTLQARLKEAGIYAGLGSNNIRVVDLAQNLREPTGPPRGALLAGGFFISGILGLFACFARESASNTVRTPDDVRSWIGLKCLALLPLMNHEKKVAEGRLSKLGKLLQRGEGSAAEGEPRTITLTRPLTAEAEAMRDLRTALFYSRMGAGPTVVLISSSMEGEGKTTVAVNLANALAHVGPTCIVDADLRQPMVARAYGVQARVGLSDVLTETEQLSKALVQLDIANLWLLPSGSPVESPADILASARMQEVCRTLRNRFSYVVIDSPPVIRFSDARFLSRLADEVVLVGRYGMTTRRAFQRSAELLQDVKAPVAGAVLNGIDLSSPDYHYFTYGYSKIAGKQHHHGYRGSAHEDNQPNKNEGARGAHA